MTLSETEMHDLRILAGMMIPASETYGVPGADDPAILADIVGTMGRDTADVRAALAELSAVAGGSFADLAVAARREVAIQFLSSNSPALATLSRVIVQCYYRDDRVVRSMGQEPRAPFPKGHKLEQGDWSLLDPVRSRPKMWRDVPPSG